MAHTDGDGVLDVLYEQAGALFYAGAQDGGATSTPLLTMTGGLTGGRTVTSNTFVMSNDVTLDAAAQNVVTETTSLAAPDSDIYLSTQALNYCGIIHRAVTISYLREAVTGLITGESVLGVGTTGISKMQKQREIHLRQAAMDLNYGMHLGVSTDPTSAAVAGATCGVITAVDADGSTEINASSAALSKDLILQLEAAMLAAAVPPVTPVIFTGAYQIQALNELFGFAPEDRSVGGVALNTIYLPTIGPVGVVYDSTVTTSVLALYDVSKIAPVFLQVPGKPAVFFEEIGKVGAATTEQLFLIAGVDYQRADSHGIIKGLATS